MALGTTPVGVVWCQIPLSFQASLGGTGVLGPFSTAPPAPELHAKAIAATPLSSFPAICAPNANSADAVVGAKGKISRLGKDQFPH